MKRSILILFFTAFFHHFSFSQLFKNEKQFTKGDTLRGFLSPERTCYDQTYNHLDVKINFLDKSISGSNTIYFKVITDFNRLQIDLFPNMIVDKIEDENGKILSYKREFGAVFVDFSNVQKTGQSTFIKVSYHGQPQIAKNAPWDGGFVWKKDKNDNDFVAVACQGTGASLWWPCKDHQEDEVDSMLISITSPSKYSTICNGKLRSKTKINDTETTSNWFVSYPINNYNVTFNIADYANFSDQMPNGLILDYYVLSYNLEKAKEHFKQVKPMMTCYEKFFGEYPFARDNYKLVETPYLGMEHQSAVAYGNEYKMGYLGTDLSSTGIGNKFDYIIIHETGHEWWGNNVTSKDLADMWVHEGFCTYGESIYVECMYGKDSAIAYINGSKSNVGNRSSIIGFYGLNKEGSGDMYNKGSLFLNTVRTIINNDEVWFKILKGIQTEFGLKTTTSDEIIDYISKESGKNIKKIAEQYLNYPSIPELQLKFEKNIVSYRWKTDVKDFEMPLRLMLKNEYYITLQGKNDWQDVKINTKKNDLQVDEDHFYIKTNRIN